MHGLKIGSTNHTTWRDPVLIDNGAILFVTAKLVVCTGCNQTLFEVPIHDVTDCSGRYTQSQSHTHSHTHTVTHTHSHTHSHTHTQSHTHTHSHTVTATHGHTATATQLQSHSHTATVTQPQSHTVTVTVTVTHTHRLNDESESAWWVRMMLIWILDASLIKRTRWLRRKTASSPRRMRRKRMVRFPMTKRGGQSTTRTMTSW